MSNGRSSGHAADDRQAHRLETAEAVFAAWLDSTDECQEADFERLCAGHESIAAELRRLWRALVRYDELRDRALRLLRAPIMRMHAARR